MNEIQEHLIELAKDQVTGKIWQWNSKKCSLCSRYVTQLTHAMESVQVVFGHEMLVCAECANVLLEKTAEFFKSSLTNDLINNLAKGIDEIQLGTCPRCGSKTFLFDRHCTDEPYSVATWYFGCRGCKLQIEYGELGLVSFRNLSEAFEKKLESVIHEAQTSELE